MCCRSFFRRLALSRALPNVSRIRLLRNVASAVLIVIYWSRLAIPRNLASVYMRLKRPRGHVYYGRSVATGVLASCFPDIRKERRPPGTLWF
jgi:hypothetical protein